MRHIFDSLESNVRSYSRVFPAVFDRAKGASIWDAAGVEYTDLFAGAGALNYGHNPDHLKTELAAYFERDGITHSLDMMTTAKAAFLSAFSEVILRPRNLDYKFLFPGPAGTNAVEAALKLARKATGRTAVAAFTNGFHGMSLGALAATGSAFKRASARIDMGGIQRLPFEHYYGPGIDTVAMIERLLDDPSSGFEPPAAFMVEPIQGEGGLNAVSPSWLARIAALARRHGSLLIVDDIQSGCGRAGSFFSFDGTGVVPDVVCLSKSLSGYGLPLAMLLVAPECDVFEPGEHNGTFRGCNPAFVAATAALSYWNDPAFLDLLDANIAQLDAFLHQAGRQWPGRTSARGRGMMRGLVLQDGDQAATVCAEAFARRVILETSGGNDEVLKFLPPLNIDTTQFARALACIDHSLAAVLGPKATDVAAAQPWLAGAVAA